ncbi:MAG: hypothetical protein ACRDZV_12310 [Acidimicrobiia bacterium]
MTAERFTRRWVRSYTRGLSDEVRTARCEEIDSDLHEHRTTGAHGAAIVGRTLRGVAADVSWRREERRAVEAINGRLTGVRALWATATQAWFAPFAVLIGVFNVLMAVAVFVEEDGKMPGQVIGPIVVLGLTAALLTGLRLRWRSGQPAAVASGPTVASSAPPASTRRRIALVVLAFLAVVAVILGAMSSFFLLAAGVLTLAAVAALARRGRGVPRIPRVRPAGAEHVMLADVLIVIGTLPALALWWLIAPGVLALIVIGGVIGTGPRTRERAAY